jgi:multiple sugar transport system ATP-binding protein
MPYESTNRHSPSEAALASVTFKNVWKYFGDQPVVRDLDLEIADGEFMVIVGASGCGKTTTLRMLAGLETPSYGQIFIGDEDVTTAKPGDRDIAMVFQSYALYPHMTVYKNLAFGPSVRGESRQKQRERIEEVSATLGLDKLLARRPSELSGGQRQRVALGRVMLREPRLSLFDEPLSNLDAALRVQMRGEIVRLQQRAGVTTAYVTHDQVEAMTMGDRIALMENGRLLQLDTPQGMYERPATMTVASFIGSPKMNFVAGDLSAGPARVVKAMGTTFELDPHATELMLPSPEERSGIQVGLRPQDLYLSEDAPPRCSVTIKGRVDTLEPTGSEAFARLIVDECRIVARLPRSALPELGQQIEVAFDPADVHLFDDESRMTIAHRHVVNRAKRSELR